MSFDLCGQTPEPMLSSLRLPQYLMIVSRNIFAATASGNIAAQSSDRHVALVEHLRLDSLM